MLKYLQRFGLVVSVASLMLGLLPAAPARAAGAGCSVNDLTVVVQPGNQNYLGFKITNTSGTVLQWVRISRPNSDYAISSASVGGWSMGADVSSLVLMEGTIDPGDVLAVDVWTTANVWQAGSSNWVVSASDDPNGGGAVNCTGAVASSIRADLPPGQAGVGVTSESTDTTTSSAIVRWSTTAPTGSVVLYGATTQYGTYTNYDGNLVSEHVVVLSGLQTGAIYHYRTVGVDENGGYVYSVDRTFTTVALPKPVVTPPKTGKASSTPVAVVADTQAPTIVLQTNLSRPVTGESVTVAGTAADNVAVARIEYSLDGGKNWFSVKNVMGLGTKSANWSFSPTGLEDGNFSLVLRAADASGNVVMTVPATLVIDRDPPRIGAALVSVGPQVVASDSTGRFRVASGTEETITMNAVGGAVSIVVVAARVGAVHAGQSFSLRRDNVSGLWSGPASFGGAGVYHLVANAVDGAGNRTSRGLPDVVVAGSAKVVDKVNGRGIKGAKVTLYYHQAASGRWLVWDGAPYVQTNPQKVTPAGSFALLAPAGEYYLKAEAPGYRTLVTHEFSVKQPAPVVPTLKLVASPKLHLGSWTWTIPGITLSQTTVDLTGGYDESGTVASSLVGHNFPAFRLPKTTGEIATPVSFQGKPTVVVALATWAPATAEQLPALAAVAKSLPGVNVAPLYVGERAGKVQTTLSRAGYDLAAIVDSKATLGDQLGIVNVPTLYFVDRRGKVVSVHSGVMPEAELRQRLLSGL